MVARNESVRNVHGRRNVELGWQRMCKTIHGRSIEEESDEEGDVPGEVHREKMAVTEC